MAKAQNRRKTGKPRPPNGEKTRWKPGQSGNPKGRPRTAKFSEAMAQLWKEIGKSGDSKAEELAAHCFTRAMGGSVRHAELCIAYVEGKPRQAYEVNMSIIDELHDRVKRARERAGIREDAENDARLAKENDGKQVRIRGGKGGRDGKQ